MDYTQRSLPFKIRKVLRYLAMYGPLRTRIKVLGQLHMKTRFEPLPAQKGGAEARRTVGLIGCGNYAFSNIAYFLANKHGSIISSCMDKDIHRAASLARHYDVPSYSDDANTVLDDPNVKVVFIASNHASHAEYAIQALHKGKHVYIEKPHVVTYEQLDRLYEAMQVSPGRVFLGFNRPKSRFGRIILDRLRREEGPGMYNWFVAGHAINADHWYARPEEGGRVLGNLCHWTDFVLSMGDGRFPIVINPTRGSKNDNDIAVTMLFPDETIAAITFSAKGHTFEGVREHLSAHRGNCLLSMNDYKTLTIESGHTKTRLRNTFRDHGHQDNILMSYELAMGRGVYDREKEMRHLLDTGWLFLKTRDALTSGEPITVNHFPG